jgi:hypothetical protein
MSNPTRANERAFPVPEGVVDGMRAEPLDKGMTLREYFMAHAPAEPQKWFEPKMTTNREPPFDLACNFQEEIPWDREYQKQRCLQWPAAWADEQITIIGNMI